MRKNPLPRFWPFLNIDERRELVNMMVEHMQYTLDALGEELDERLYRLSDEANDVDLRDRFAKALSSYIK